jgi:uncharacterized membrane protein YagU involved in acid resistance
MEKQVKRPFFWALTLETFRSGSIAAVAMIPFGLLFFALGLRVNEYGLKVIRTFFGDQPAGVRFVLFAVEHFIISWSVSIPLLLTLLATHRKFPAFVVGLVYGAGFYVLMNSLALPWIFGDLPPWQLGFEVIYPSLIIHLIYGIVIALTSRMFINRYTNQLKTNIPKLGAGA